MDVMNYLEVTLRFFDLDVSARATYTYNQPYRVIDGLTSDAETTRWVTSEIAITL